MPITSGNLLIWLRTTNRVVGNLLLIAGDDAFRMANTYYASVHMAARRNILGAEQVFRMLHLFWRCPRRPGEELVTDNTQKKPRGGFKEILMEEAERSKN